MRRFIPWISLAAWLALAPQAAAQQPDSLELLRLESVWNRAHVDADTVALAALWAPEFVARVPAMRPMTREELLAFWRTGRSTILRYQTDHLQVRVGGDTATVDGTLARERRFGDQLVVDQWRFRKRYRRTAAGWQVHEFIGTATAP